MVLATPRSATLRANVRRTLERAMMTETLVDASRRRDRRHLWRPSSRVLARTLLEVAGVGILVGVWELLSIAKGQVFVPSPWSTLRDISENFFSSPYLEAHGLSQTYFSGLVYSARNVLVGVLLGTVGGVSLGIASKWFRLIGEIVNPIIATFGTAPIFVAAPFFLIWFGIVSGAQILLVTFYTFLLMYIFGRRAADNVGSVYVEYALTLGAERLSLLRHIYLPGAIPELIGGFRVALAGAWGLEVIAELLGAQQGVGFLISFYTVSYDLKGMLALVVMLGVFAVVIDRICLFAALRLTTWMAAGAHVG